MRERSRFQSKMPLLAAALAFTQICSCNWGVVRDQTGKPVAGATVSYRDSQGRDDSTRTNDAGLYMFCGTSTFCPIKGPLPPVEGEVTYIVSAPGCQTLTTTRAISYDENPHADPERPESFWAIEHFTLECEPLPPPADFSGTWEVLKCINGGIINFCLETELWQIDQDGPEVFIEELDPFFPDSVHFVDLTVEGRTLSGRQITDTRDFFCVGKLIKERFTLTLDEDELTFAGKAKVTVELDCLPSFSFTAKIFGSLIPP